jgi:hypothetical protein
MRRAIKDIKLASPGPGFYFPRLCSADRARCRGHELKSSYDLPMQLLPVFIALSVFPGLGRRAFLEAATHLADRRTVEMLAAPIPRLSARLERPGLNVWTGQDEMVADAPKGQDRHALNLSAFA